MADASNDFRRVRRDLGPVTMDVRWERGRDAHDLVAPALVTRRGEGMWQACLDEGRQTLRSRQSQP